MRILDRGIAEQVRGRRRQDNMPGQQDAEIL
jgi:hypothetical protein